MDWYFIYLFIFFWGGEGGGEVADGQYGRFKCCHRGLCCQKIIVQETMEDIVTLNSSLDRLDSVFGLKLGDTILRLD